jgi:hypothetical protein
MNNSSGFGFVWESITGVTETALMALSSTTGNLATKGTVTANSVVLTFTGGHLLGDKTGIPENINGLIIESIGIVNKTDEINTLVNIKLSNTNKSKKVYGVTHWFKNDEYPDEPDRLSLCTVSLGEGTMLVTNYNGNISNGDYICSSLITGYGMLQDDDILHNYTVAKSTEEIDWNLITDIINYNNIEYKKVLIACTFHCG